MLCNKNSSLKKKNSYFRYIWTMYLNQNDLEQCALLLLQCSAFGKAKSHKHQFTFYLGKTRLSTFPVDCHLLFSLLGGLGWIPFFYSALYDLRFQLQLTLNQGGQSLIQKISYYLPLVLYTYNYFENFHVLFKVCSNSGVNQTCLQKYKCQIMYK